MTEIDPTHDYSTGEPRRHHNLYLEDGNLVLQVEKGIFKIHRSVFARYSSVMRDMLNRPNITGSVDGTDERPLILSDDSVVGWELLLSLQYDGPNINSERLNREHLLSILPIAHKYGMEKIEADVINQLKKTTIHDGFVDLVVASRIIDSNELYLDGIKRLTSSSESLTLEQAKRVGIEATHAVMSGRPPCAHCKWNGNGWRCPSCPVPQPYYWDG